MPHKNFTVSYKKKSAIDKNLTQKKTIFVALTLREKCPNTESVYSCIRTEYRKIRARKNSVFGHFSRSGIYVSWSLGDDTQMNEM